MADIANILKTHMEELTSLFDGVLDLNKLLVDSPDFAAEIIAYAAGEPDSVDNVKVLPFGVQLVALSKIWDLTAVDVDEMGKLFRSLQEATKPQELQLKTNSKTGSKA